MSVVGATDTFSRRPLSPASRSFIESMLKAHSGEGFRTPALCGTVVRVAGPAFESLPRRKPRGGRTLIDRARSMGI
jgi:hypothetical protein